MDTIKPTFTRPADITLYKDANCSVNDLPTGLAGDVTNEHDNCSTGLQATYSDVRVDNCEGTYTITRTWSLEDHCNNHAADQVQTITVLDTIKPTFTRPANTTIYSDAHCAYNASTTITGDVTDEHDNCSTHLDATFTDVVVDGICSGNHIINRIWHLTDHCGNSAINQVQVITVLDTIAPTFNPPANITIYTDTNCNYIAATSITGLPYALTDNCTSVGALLTTFADVVTPGSCVGAYSITRTWKVTDCAGNFTTHVQIITVADSIAPRINAIANQVRCANSTYITYTPNGTEFNLTYSDNCNVASTNYSLSGATIGSGYTSLANVIFNSGVTNVSFTVTDCANNHTTFNYTITINPLPTPIIVGPAAVCCSTEYSYFDQDNTAGSYSYQWTISGGTIVSGANSYNVVVKWNCNCTSGWLQLIKTNTLTTCASTAYFNNVVVNPLPTPVINGDTTVYTNDTNVHYWLTSCIPGNLYSWSIIGGTVVSGQGTCSIYISWDVAACQDCPGSVSVSETAPSGCVGTSTINISQLPAPGTHKLSGKLTYDNANNTPLNGVTIQLIKNGVLIGTTTTVNGIDQSGNPVSGYYEFNNISYGDYSLYVNSTKPWGGVTATDALLIKLHTIGSIALTGLPLVAADVNASSSINATDALLVQLRIVGLVNQFAAGDWKFNNTLFTFSAANPTYDFKGICVGDINKSYNITGLKHSTSANDGVIDIPLYKSFTYNIKCNSAADLGAMTLFMNYDQSSFEIEQVNDVLTGMTYKIDNGQLAIAWSNLQAANVHADDTIISLKMRAKRIINQPNQIFSYDVNSEFADPNAVVLDNFDLKMPNVLTVTKGFKVTNYPNPAKDVSNLIYTLPEQAKVKIIITNILGQPIRTLLDEDQSEGTYTLSIDANDLNLISGMYLYEMEVNGITTKYSKLGKIVFER